MSETKQSIYEYMASQIHDGELPASFSLPQEEGTAGQLKWSDGAMDGMYIYHTAHGELPKEALDSVSRAVQDASSGDMERADRSFADLIRRFQAIAVTDTLLDYITEHEESLNAGNIYRFAIHLMIESPEREEVKLGLALMQLFDSSEEILRDIIRSLGLSDEFTLYSLLNMLRWENADEEVFELARHVHGWGRIHAVERMDPATPQIRDWLLTDGIRNEVMPEYSALTVFYKAEVDERLREDPLDPAHFRAAGDVLSALLSEGPVAGISAVEGAAGVLLHYLDQADRQKLMIRDYELISQIYYYTAAKGGKDRIMASLSERSSAMLHTPAAEECVRAALKKGEGIELAVALGIPYQKEVFLLMQKDFEHNYRCCGYLMDDPVWSEAVLDLYRKRIRLEDLEDDPRDEMGLGDGWADYVRLDVLLEAMKGECRTAGDILMKTLGAPTVRTRYLTLQCLKDWTEKAGQPLSTLSLRIYDRLSEVYEREPREDLRVQMKALLEH
ncbi:MAG: hypothetical protein IJR62_01460 [Lachnospiraceae bacterium]|nr:hypothetical protein [Lachnospiraceae bacterium]